MSSHPAPDDTNLKFSTLFPILLVLFTNIVGAGVIIPILPLYAEGEFAGTVPQITLLASVFFGAQFIAAPYIGRLSDRFGRRPVLIVSQLGTVLAFVLFIFAGPLGGLIDGLGLPLPMTGGMVMLFVARILDGITGGNITAAQAWVSDMTTEQTRAQGLGWLQAAFGAGFIFGPAFGGVLAGFGTVAPFIGAAIITTGTLLLTTFTLKESLPDDARVYNASPQREVLGLRQVIGNRGLVLLVLVTLFGSLAFSALPATFALYASAVLFADFDDPATVQLLIGLMLTLNGIMQVSAQLGLLKRLVARYGEARVLVMGQMAIAATFLAIVPLSNAILVTPLFAGYALGQGLAEPSVQSLFTRFGTGRSRGQLLGVYQSTRSAALIIGPIWAGYAFEAISPQAVFVVAGILMIIAFSLGLLFQRVKIEPIVPEVAAAD